MKICQAYFIACNYMHIHIQVHVQILIQIQIHMEIQIQPPVCLADQVFLVYRCLSGTLKIVRFQFSARCWTEVIFIITLSMCFYTDTHFCSRWN